MDGGCWWARRENVGASCGRWSSSDVGVVATGVCVEVELADVSDEAAPILCAGCRPAVSTAPSGLVRGCAGGGVAAV